MRPIGITATGMYVPERRVTNHELAQSLDTSDDWIFEKIGIRERRLAGPNQATSDLALEAAKMALAGAGLAPADIDVIVLATSSPDMLQPPTAAILQGRLGAVNAGTFDISAVCAGSVYALDVGVGLMRSHPEYRNVLVVAAEAYSRILDWTDRTTCVYFGDGAGAVVLQEVEPGLGASLSRLGSDGSQWDAIRYPGGGTRYPTSHDTIDRKLHRLEMDGKRVWAFTTTVVPQAILRTLNSAGLGVQDLDFVVFHQANINIIRSIMGTLGMTMDKTYTCVERYGNMSGASLLVALHEACGQGKLHAGDKVALIGFGSGLAWGVSLWNWAF